MNHARHILIALLLPFLAVAAVFAQDEEMQRRIEAETAARDAAMAAEAAAEAAHGDASAAKDAAITAQRQAQLDAALKAVGEPRSTLACIVIGQVQPVAARPGPANARTVRIHVLRTLRGPDLAGTALTILPQKPLEAGRSHLYTLTISPLAEHARVDAIEEPTAQRIKELTDGPPAVAPRQVFWMYRQGGPKDEQLIELKVRADGAVTYTCEVGAAPARHAMRQTFAGRLDPQRLDPLIKAIESAREINANPPQGVVSFRWIADGTHHFKLFADVTNPPASDLLGRAMGLAEGAVDDARKPGGVDPTGDP